MGQSVSVITTVLNERGSIGALLDAFLSQTLPPDEIIVADGGSTDGTTEILAEYAQKHKHVRYFVEDGANIARGRNIAIEHSGSSIIAVTDGGCCPEHDWLAELIRPLTADQSYGAVSGRRKISARNRFEFFAGRLSTSIDSGVEDDRVFHGRNSAFRKEVWRAAGGYPEWLYTAEDTLFARRAKALGCRVAFAPDAVVLWRPRPNLYRLAKQHFLYGRGTGHISQTNLKSALYHLRNHSIWILTLLMGFISPWFWPITVGVLAFMYLTLILPTLKMLRTGSFDPFLEFYVPAIVMTRSLSNNLGQVVGLWQYHHAAAFRKNLELYTEGRWQRCRSDGSRF